jgi:hypothetical protein
MMTGRDRVPAIRFAKSRTVRLNVQTYGVVKTFSWRARIRLRRFEQETNLRPKAMSDRQCALLCEGEARSVGAQSFYANSFFLIESSISFIRF